jgi:hypothetical protein
VNIVSYGRASDEGLAELCHPDGWQVRQQKFTLYFDNSSMRNTKHSRTNGSLWLLKMDHPAYRPDVAPCDFPLFGYVKKNVAGQSLDTDEELLSG